MKLSIRYLIAFFILAIILAVLLNGVIGQMREQIFCVFDVVFAGCGADVTISIPVTLYLAVVAGDCHIVSYIELATLVEQRSLDVLLHDERTICAVGIALF